MIPPDFGPIPDYSSDILGIPKSALAPFILSGSIGEKISPQEFWSNIEELNDKEFNITPFHKFDMVFQEGGDQDAMRFLSLLNADDQTSLSDVYERVVKDTPENKDLAFTAILRHFLIKSISP